MPKNNHPANFAITIADDQDRTYYFNERDDLESFMRGLLVGEDESRDFATDFKVYQKAKGAWWEWIEKDFDPYDLFEDIDDTVFPLAHGQLLANYGNQVDHKTLWNIAQGQEGAINLIPSDSIRSRIRDTYKALHSVGAWSEPVEGEIVESDVENFDLQATLHSQQEFSMNREDMIRHGDLLEHRLIKQHSLNHVEACYIFNCSEGDWNERLNEVLALRDSEEDEFDFELPNGLSTSDFGFGELNNLEDIGGVLNGFEE